MNNGYIAVLDSGIGGLSVLSELVKIMPNERYLYFGDNDNAPYGNKDKKLLRRLTFNALSQIFKNRVKALVVGCNTLSVSIMSDIIKMAHVPVFGVYPPVESECLSDKKCLLVCTPNTASKYTYKYDNLDVLSLPYLASDIERKIFNIDSIDLSRHVNLGVLYSKNKNFLSKKCIYDTLILGCTHYFFAKNEFYDHFQPQKIIGGNHFTAKMVKNFLLNSKSLGNSKRLHISFNGKNAKFNKKVWVLSGQKVLF